MSVGALFAPCGLRAQGPGLFETFAARKESTSDPLFGGISLAGFNGPFGLRLSGALNPAADSSSDSQSGIACDRFRCRRTYGGSQSSLIGYHVGAWNADVDFIVAPLRTVPIAQALLLGFSPYAFVGIGGTGIRPNSAADTNRATLSYGAGVYHTLAGILGLGAEARYRRSLQSDSVISLATRRGWEYRVGLTFAFGGHRAPAPQPQVVVTAPPAPLVASGPPRASEVVIVDEQAVARRAARLLDLAEGYVDTPYRAGGTSSSTGFDAPGFVQAVYASEGIRLPRLAREMAVTGDDVPTRVGSLRPGDLLFFANDGTAIDHVAIYVGHDRIIHATASGGGVRYDVLGEGERGKWFADHLVTARRVIRDAGVRTRVAPEEGSDTPDRAPKPASPTP